MAITATAGAITSTIDARRPSWEDMSQHYPGKEMGIEELYNTIGGQFAGQHQTEYLSNTCATRMSYGLLRSGFNLKRTKDKGASLSGADGKWYWLRVADLRGELYDRFKGFDAELKFDLIRKESKYDPVVIHDLYLARKAQAEDFFRKHLVSKNGIIVFKVQGWQNATGHFTLWDGESGRLAYAPGHDNPGAPTFYPWLTEHQIDKKTGAEYLFQVVQIQFWELK